MDLLLENTLMLTTLSAAADVTKPHNKISLTSMKFLSMYHLRLFLQTFKHKCFIKYMTTICCRTFVEQALSSGFNYIWFII